MVVSFSVHYHHRYEENAFNTGGGGGSADYAMMLMFCSGALLLINFYLKAYVMGQALLYSVLYSWSRKEPSAMVSLWGFNMQVRRTSSHDDDSW